VDAEIESSAVEEKLVEMLHQDISLRAMDKISEETVLSIRRGEKGSGKEEGRRRREGIRQPWGEI
jgi:hypothetical protein